jgi:putative copper resistance protein D
MPARPAGAVEIATAAARRTLAIGALAAALAALGWAGATLAGIKGDFGEIADPGTLSAFFFATSFGGVWMLRLVVAASLAAAVLLLRRRLFERNLATAIIAALAAVLLASQAWIGHPASLPPSTRIFAIAAYVVHVLAVGSWIGGLLPLGFVLAGARRAGGEAVVAAGRAVHRFSAAGMAAVAALLAGGMVNAYFRLGSLAALATTAWGRLLACKIALFLALVAVAFVNRFVLLPRLPARPEPTMASLARGIVFEQVAGLLALAVAALLGILAPPQ